MRRIDGITSSKFGLKVLKEVKEHPFLVEASLLISIVIVTFLLLADVLLGSTPVLGEAVPPPTRPATAVVQKIIGEPVQLSASTISLDTEVEKVGLTKSGAMDVPSDTARSGWYQYGYKPGEPGNAVITGHVDTLWLQPAVFADIDQLVAGDRVSVTDQHGSKLQFEVEKISRYGLKDLPLQEIFGPSEERRLNLITCSGKWSWKIGNYTERTVVFTKLVTPIVETASSSL